MKMDLNNINQQLKKLNEDNAYLREENERLKAIDERECQIAIQLKKENTALKEALKWYAEIARDKYEATADSAKYSKLYFRGKADAYADMEHVINGLVSEAL